jgi:hypothetical protein
MWIKLKCRLPYQIFPGIFSSIDSFSKKVTWTYFEKYKKLPPWFDRYGKFVKPMKVPHFTTFGFKDEGTGVELRGVPDEVFLCEDGSYVVVDYKTARFTDHQDRLLGMYEIQLNAYGLIGEKTGLFSPVDKLLLVYYEPHGGLLEVGDLDEVLKKDGFRMPFEAHIMEVPMEGDSLIRPLLRQVRELWEISSPPDGRTGCDDCRLLGELVSMVTTL